MNAEKANAGNAVSDPYHVLWEDPALNVSPVHLSVLPVTRWIIHIGGMASYPTLSRTLNQNTVWDGVPVVPVYMK